MRWALSLVVASVLLGVAAARAGTLIVGPLYKPPVTPDKIVDVTVPASWLWFNDMSGCSPNRLLFLQIAEDVLFEIAGSVDGDYALYDVIVREQKYCDFVMRCKPWKDPCTWH